MLGQTRAAASSAEGETNMTRVDGRCQLRTSIDRVPPLDEGIGEGPTASRVAVYSVLVSTPTMGPTVGPSSGNWFASTKYYKLD